MKYTFKHLQYCYFYHLLHHQPITINYINGLILRNKHMCLYEVSRLE
jgi:hypothetical protein